MEYQTSTSTPLSGYTSIGSTRESVLRHAELGTVGGPSGEVPVVPSYVFYLYRSDFITSTIKSPSDCVLVSLSHPSSVDIEGLLCEHTLKPKSIVGHAGKELHQRPRCASCLDFWKQCVVLSGCQIDRPIEPDVPKS